MIESGEQILNGDRATHRAFTSAVGFAHDLTHFQTAAGDEAKARGPMVTPRSGSIAARIRYTYAWRTVGESLLAAAAGQEIAADPGCGEQHTEHARGEA